MTAPVQALAQAIARASGHYDGDAPAILDELEAEGWSLTAPPRPFYVNHRRAEPVAGDIAQDADKPSGEHWAFGEDDRWWSTLRPRVGPFAGDEIPARLRLVIDGETGQVVR